MNLKVTLAKRENEIAECVAWGGSYKETASLLQISVRTVDNTLRKVIRSTKFQHGGFVRTTT